VRTKLLAAAVAAVASIPVLAAGCEPVPLGELVLIVKTDMAPPKDFNKMRIQVFNEGQLKFLFEGAVPGDPGEEQRIVLPSTLGLVASDDPANAIRIEVGVRSGGKEGPVRVVREVVTTIPADRVAMLHVPIQFLCKKDDIPFDNDGNLKASDCPDGKTCIAGSCQDNVIDSSTLPDYNAKEVFGGSGDPAKGACFDVAKCFEKAELVDLTTLESGACTFPAPATVKPAELNLALGVESDGVCNGLGCFVVLDANSDTGWKLSEDKSNIVLPKGVCDNITSTMLSGLKVLQIVQAQTGDGCPQKDVTYPTCGPWSAVESAPPPKPIPTAIAGGQDHPLSVATFATADGTFGYWTNGGSTLIKGASLAGGPVIEIKSDEPPRDILATDKALLWTTTKPSGTGSVYAYLSGGTLVQLRTGYAQPEGIAIFGDKLFWTEFAAGGKVYAGTLKNDFSDFTADPVAFTVDVPNNYPARIVADNSYVYFTNEGAYEKKNGSVVRIQHANGAPTPLFLADPPADPMAEGDWAAPRALAIDIGPDKLAKDLYFATLGDGNVWRVPDAGSATPGKPVVFASGLKQANGLAIDGKNVYITDFGSGSVVYKAKDAATDVPVTVIATNQRNPGAIVVDGDTLLWVNQGNSDPLIVEGSVIKLDKSTL
jgi:hypothetical protein